ncbi:MAG: hypothetical protein MJ215_04290 [Spirochaetia bacterium]|nr:hypothetical protein [Spirochaetia bacterium]
MKKEHLHHYVNSATQEHDQYGIPLPSAPAMTEFMEIAISVASQTGKIQAMQPA